VSSLTIGEEITSGINAAFDAAQRKGVPTLTPTQMLEGACRGKVPNEAFLSRYKSVLRDLMTRCVIKAHRDEENKPVAFERLKPGAKH
jgi:hypothetical protein